MPDPVIVLIIEDLMPSAAAEQAIAALPSSSARVAAQGADVVIGRSPEGKYSLLKHRDMATQDVVVRVLST